MSKELYIRMNADQKNEHHTMCKKVFEQILEIGGTNKYGNAPTWILEIECFEKKIISSTHELCIVIDHMIEDKYLTKTLHWKNPDQRDKVRADFVTVKPTALGIERFNKAKEMIKNA